ncbi:hypothetical protein KBX37_21750 [Micromonospora sp. U56]|uniref:hypothetical protein n=1 Tax=Micromonospora sp. U56 TaxID=2824900 RepID=UPI001B375548|nr:hypothetical protein [Micromonospora sp. U56]MBQ0895687.1 hypothetical protein [Micromonospora sp. U56]
MAAARPTPADPTPGVRTAAREAGNQRAMPPDLGPGSLAVLSGPTAVGRSGHVRLSDDA